MDATHTPEEWRPVVGYEGYYEVSNLGRVRSLDRRVSNGSGNTRIARGVMLKPSLRDGFKYYVVNLGHGRGRRRTVQVHILVLEAFVGPRPDGLIACHNDGIHLNNRSSNLRWDTYSENLRDQVRHGIHFGASKTHCKNGHEFTPENTKVYNGTWRRCIACEKIADRKKVIARKLQRERNRLARSA